MLKISRRSLPVVLLLALAIPGMASDAEIPEELQGQLEAVLDARVKEIGEEHSDNDNIDVRGSYSHRFHAAEDGGYSVMLTKDTAYEGNLLCESYRVTLGQGGSGDWQVT